MPTQADTPAASLVGALGVFSVPDVLRLIAGGRHDGEVLVVANGLDGRLWLRDGDLTGAAVRGTTTLAQAVFELALLEDGWFYFTSGRVAPEPAPPQSVDDVLAVVLPQVVEWRDLLHRVPLDAVVGLAPSPPQAQVQLSATEWQVLAAVGGRGARVIDVVAATGRDQVQTVRTLRDMADAGLVTITGGTAPGRSTPGAGAGAAAPSPPPPATGTPLPPPPTSPTALHRLDPEGPAGPTAAAPATTAAPADGALVPMAMAAGPAPTLVAARAVASDPPLPPLPVSDGDMAGDHLPAAPDDHAVADLDTAGAAGA